jgi:hypothetical protein
MKQACAASCPLLCDAVAPPPPPPAAGEQLMQATDARTGATVGVFARGVQAAALPPHSSRLLVVRPAPPGARRRSLDRGLAEPGGGLPVALGRITAAAAGAATLCLCVMVARIMLRRRKLRRS